MTKLPLKSLSDEVFERVQHDIMSGALAADTPIRQDALAESLGVSKIPVREALTRLEQMGFVVSLPRRGYHVRGYSLSEAEEIFQIRLALEPKATAAGAAAASTDDRKIAANTLAALEAEVRAGGLNGGKLNREFHRSLLLPARQPMTLEILMRLHMLAERYVNLHLKPAGRGARAEEAHREILEAWSRGDTSDVEHLLAIHSQEALEDLREMMPSD
jgi:DNA-binding GntR family transcriptional regulator